MGLFDSVLGAIQTQAGATGGQGDMMGTVMALVNEHGGLAGLVQKLSAGGLGEQVASWVGTGSNLPVTAEQIQAALGSPALQGIAARLGIDPAAAASGLAALLPQAVDTLTPGGQLPSGDIGQALAGLFGGK